MVHVFNFCSWEISDFDFPISGHLFLFTSRYCRVPQNQCSTSPPFFIVLLYSDAVCFIGIFGWSILDFLCCVNLFVRMLCGLPYFNHRAVLSFWTAGRLLFGGLSITTSKSTPDGLLEKTLNGFITHRCIKFANYWRGIFSFIKFGFSWTELEWCGVGSRFLFRCCCR